jgi:hypothetical protein
MTTTRKRRETQQADAFDRTFPSGVRSSSLKGVGKITVVTDDTQGKNCADGKFDRRRR